MLADREALAAAGADEVAGSVGAWVASLPLGRAAGGPVDPRGSWPRDVPGAGR